MDQKVEVRWPPRHARLYNSLSSVASGMAMLAVASLLAASCGSLVGTKLASDLVLDHGFPPKKVDLAARIAGKKVIMVGLPGAFTPT